VVSSDAVFEHIKNLPVVLSEFSRVLKPGGLLYASFGPLWYGYGGDHISGYDDVKSGYSHLLMSKADYICYISRLGEFERNEDDGRTWVESDLFSKLLPTQYIDVLEDAGFERLFVSAMIDPLAMRALLDKTLRNALTSKYPNISIVDFAISAMTIIYRQK
jgi:ubiquinone/menaquinone biosynthesis C-methylase UbiE